jgi:hypothetical protein
MSLTAAWLPLLDALRRERYVVGAFRIVLNDQSMDWWVNHLQIGSVMPIPVVPVRPIVAVQVSVVPVSVAGATTGSAASHRVFATRSGTVLGYREGNSTRQQYCRHQDAFEDGHVASPTRRRTHPTGARRTPMEPGPFH